MFYGNTIQDTREIFFTSWEKYLNKKELLPLEQQVVQVILAHPEYHAFISSKKCDQQFFPELGQTNPFLHLGLHLVIRDQVTMNKPEGISSVFKGLLKKYKDELEVEHVMMEALAECLWQAQRAQQLPDELSYLKHCQHILESI
ncbi:Domain of uncharacterised function (DUF1841) (plasmid) [Legionella adelaidensis]|uniref:Domain of uncharacterized function (DUF1841) n=1 Tax=Legionella adelaidensis TaxID=45056 RepID=A0A0W0R0K4_9GAMM|nr:DUF1841 family protein [Legionella adelaidensis]KTC64627.1 hypothetical protein Lade_1921 [Legionella adelaidensis]VEH86095.1 Domain of uncharacterised function (DUF1841) [Legionella adelaidensis]